MNSNGSLNVLLLEDNPVDYRLLQEELRDAGAGGLCLTRAEGLAEALSRLDDGHFDVVLTDLSVPDSFGIATVEAILGRAAETPVVVLTGSQDDQTGREAVHLGAQDYLVKGETGGELLLRSLQYAIERKQTEMALKQNNVQLAETAKKQIGRYNDALQLETVERYRLEAALRESEMRFRAVFEQPAVGMAHVGMDGRFVRVNRRFCELLGYTEDELLTLGMDGVVWPEEVAQDEPQKRQLLNGAVRHYEIDRRFRCKDGGMLPMRQTLSLVRSEQGAPRYFVAVFAPLESDRGMGYQHLETERLQARSQQELAEINSELDALSYAVSHDLRAPLRAISGFSRILEREHGQELPPEALKHLGMIVDGANRLDHLIRDLLAYSRITRQPLHLQTLDLGNLLEHCLEELRPAYEGQDIDFSIGSLPMCRADPSLMKDLLLALLSNAIKFSIGRSPARIEIAGSTEDAGIHFHVRDNGIGFDMHYAQKLFGIFQRLHRPDQYPGTGIGLAVARRIVQRHGGRIWAEAVPDKGAVFFVTLPLDRDQ